MDLQTAHSMDIHTSGEVMEKRHKKEWMVRKEELIKNAKFACDNAALSYRDFYVGTCILGWSEQKQEYIVAMAGNYKARQAKESGVDKRCSERGAIDYLLTKAPDAKIVGMVVASKETGTEPGADKQNLTLHCCEECRAMLSAEHCVNRKAPIVTVNHSGKFDVMEEMTIEGMLDLYDSQSKEAVAA